MNSPDQHRSLKLTIPQSSRSPGLMLFPRDGGCVLYDPIEGNIQTNLGDFPGCRFLANSGNWLLVLDSGSNLYIIDVFSKETIPLPSLEDDGKEYVVLWLFDLPGHSYMSFCKNGDSHYTDIPLVFDDYAFHKYDSSIAVTSSGEVLLVESDPRSRTWFRLYKKDPDVEDPDHACHTVTEVHSLGGEALLLDLGFTVPANKALGIKPDSIYFTRHFRPCHCSPRDLDICVYNLATQSLHRYHNLNKMDLMDARWFLPGN
ncbi:BnaA01g13160D [Brassica napus]|uniref:BnaA01g13160D protein n=1 Tax=Brassica napus TaxID=3708 RepID=A0A078I4Q3_BRANA|nr:BnaA01g13160D [Brassica napus]